MNKEIDQVFWPTWLAVSQLRDGAEVDDGAVLYRRASQWVEPESTQITPVPGGG